MTMRIGYGYDVHRFGGRGRLKLGGVTFAHRGLAGHSDADVLLHALADALLGAIGGPDLGTVFPPSDPRWRGADSARFVREASARIARRKWRVANVDAT
ncbi:MAG TPA: 2-C-methyl-D-erythritol 2,4-cyclodiphosphate synthase, partial [bacterium]